MRKWQLNLGVALVTGFLAPGCSVGTEATDSPEVVSRADWTAEIALDVGIKLGGCAVGNLLPERPGDEIALVSDDGVVRLIYREGKTWVNKVLFQAPGMLVQCAIGDIDPARPGNEIVAVGRARGEGGRRGGPGHAYVISRTPDGWVGEPVLSAEAYVHAVCVAAGGAVVAGFDRKAHRIYREGGEWRSEIIADLPGPGKGAIAYKDGAVVACSDGSLVFLQPGAPWRVTTLHARESGRARVATDGEQILVSDDDGVLTLLTPTGTDAWNAQEIYREELRLRGAVLADLEPDRPGLEACTVGHGMRLTLIALGPDGKWLPRTLFTDTDKFHHVVAGHVSGGPDKDLVACGYSGRLIVLKRTQQP